MTKVILSGRERSLPSRLLAADGAGIEKVNNTRKNNIA